jgi:uncharacterized protein (DUF779 family)
MTRFAIQRVRATPEAIRLIADLVERHGPVAFFLAGDDCEGATATCLTRAELLPDEDEIKLGEVSGAPFYVDGLQYRRWGQPGLEIDVEPGAARGISLAGLDEVHFVTHTQGSDAAVQPS